MDYLGGVDSAAGGGDGVAGAGRGGGKGGGGCVGLEVNASGNDKGLDEVHDEFVGPDCTGCVGCTCEGSFDAAYLEFVNLCC